MTFPAGTVVAGYTIERVLGAGGMGTVYLARHPSLPRSDALKVLSSELSGDPQFRARFLREADLAATLDHPNIVRVHTRGETEAGQLWIAMQFIDGSDVDALLKTGPIPPPRAAHIVRQVAKALDHAHSRGLLHRDVKPANFLLTGPPGDRERVLLADFGIARARDDASGLTGTGVMMATVAYASPEAIQGLPVDQRADVYSLGCALFRMLTGRAPFHDAGGMSAVLMAHVMNPPPRATELMPGLPPEIDTVLATALAKEPEHRYRSAGDLAAAAAAALGHPQPAPPAGPLTTAPWTTTAPPPSGPAPFPPPPPAWGAPTAVSYPSGYFSGSFEPTQFAPVRGRKRRRTLVIAAVVAVIALTAAGIAAMTLRGGDSTTTKPPYAAQSFVHTYGTTAVNQRPTAVAALGPGDADVVLSLGVQPVALTAAGGELPSWLKDLLHATPAVLTRADPKAVGAAHPDLILDTDSGTTRQGYDALAAVAQTITRPVGGQTWDSGTQLTWIADILGEQNAAGHLRDQAAADQAKIRQQNPAFANKSIAVLSFSDSGLSGELAGSPPAAYLSGLGFVYDTELLAADSRSAATKPLALENLYKLKTDVVIMLRTDSAAGAGGFNGLPQELTSLPGTTVIVDQPDALAALQTAGPAATRYLNTTLVAALAQQLR
jgi:serine/threonine protein kinase/ABC-type Fe3+-hydroxamate transport system substrate-binding protein